MGIREEKKRFDQEEFLEKHQDGTSLKSEVSMETTRRSHSRRDHQHKVSRRSVP